MHPLAGRGTASTRSCNEACFGQNGCGERVLQPSFPRPSQSRLWRGYNPTGPTLQRAVSVFLTFEKGKKRFHAQYFDFRKIYASFSTAKGLERWQMAGPMSTKCLRRRIARFEHGRTKNTNCGYIAIAVFSGITHIQTPKLDTSARHGGALSRGRLELFQDNHMHLFAHPDGGRRPGIDPWTSNHQRIVFGRGPRRDLRGMPGSNSCFLSQ